MRHSKCNLYQGASSGHLTFNTLTFRPWGLGLQCLDYFLYRKFIMKLFRLLGKCETTTMQYLVFEPSNLKVEISKRHLSQDYLLAVGFSSVEIITIQWFILFKAFSAIPMNQTFTFTKFIQGWHHGFGKRYLLLHFENLCERHDWPPDGRGEASLMKCHRFITDSCKLAVATQLACELYLNWPLLALLL